MNNQHVIEELVFDISFSTEDKAFAEQAGLSDFVSKSLLGVVGNVFDEYANEHETLRIERLEIDLGVIAYQDYPHEMVERLGEQLRDRLRKLLADYRNDIRVNASGGVGSVTKSEVMLEVFEHFMRHGAFPWHYKAISFEETQRMFSLLIRTKTDALCRLLYQTGLPTDVSIRLMDILSFDDVTVVLKSLLDKRFTSLSWLIELMVDAQLDHGWLLSSRPKGRDSCFRHLWQMLLEVLLHPANRERAVNTLSVVFIKNVVRTENISMVVFGRYLAGKIDHFSAQRGEREPLREMLLLLEESNELADPRVPAVSDILLLLMRGNGEELKKWWHQMLASQHSAELSVALKNLFLYASGRQHLIETCSEPMLYEWCEYLASAQIDYLKLCGAVFIDTAEIIGLTKRQAQHAFWNQALLYYGSCEAARFSQQGFLRHLCRGRGDAFSANMFKALDAVIPHEPGAYDFGAMEEGARESLNRLDMAAVADSAMVVDGVHLSEWISGCDAAGLSIIGAQWNAILQRHAALLKRLVTIHAPRCLVRRALVNELSFEQLRDLIGLIDPAAKAFVDDVVRLICRAFVASNLVDVSKLPLQGRMLRLNDEHTLWGFTFDFVLVERGSHFNKKAYCSALLREMSAHNNCSYRALLDVMQQWFGRLSAENSYARDVLSILNDLCEDFEVAPLCISADAAVQTTSFPLVKGDLDRAFLLKVLSQEPPLTDGDAIYLQTMIAGFIENSGARDSAYLSGLLADEVKARRLIGYLSRTQFKQLLSVSGGERYRSLYPHAELLFDGIAYDMDSEASEKLRVEWLVFCCRYLYSGPLVSPAVFTKLLADYLLSRSVRDVELIVPRLTLFFERKKSEVLSHVVLDSVKRLFFKEEILAEEGGSTNAVEDTSGSKVNHNTHEFANTPVAIGDSVYIRNAGLVLLAPYLSMLFERLKLLQNNQFISADASAHAVHIMQYMADGVAEAPEYMMVLNKLMCGISTAKPVVKKALISDDEKEIINGLLSAVIGNWKGIGNTSVEGLRESFLAREGRLTFKNEQWYLLVESRSYDVLLDSLPWSYAMVKYSWMPQVINVEWR